MATPRARAMLAITSLVILFGCFTGTLSQPVVITYPTAFASAGSVSVVEGSVFQLYCTVENDMTVTFSWTLNGAALSNDPPHIRIRQDNLPERSAAESQGTGSTTVLTVDNVNTTDDGVYQCTATDSSDAKSTGDPVMLTVVSASPNGTLMITFQPSLHEPLAEEFPFTVFNDNRTGIDPENPTTPNGQGSSTPLLTCTAGHVGDDVMNYNPPTVTWIRDGQVVSTDPPTTTSNGQVTSSLTITDFALSDVGQYQCVFTDDSSEGGEVITTIPHQLDTGGPMLLIERVSDEVIILRPPNKLVIEVRAFGDYDFLEWSRSPGMLFPGAQRPENFPNYFEIYVKDNTTADDEGLYNCVPSAKPSSPLSFAPVPITGIDFAVIPPVDANTTALSSSPVVIAEGGSVNISCRSIGAPVPTISWQLNDNTTAFDQTDVETAFNTMLTGMAGDAVRPVEVTPGNVGSTLHIVSASYPEHDGVYSCIGDNGEDDVTISGTATITVQVTVIPEVQLTASRTLVNIGDEVVLTCSVIRGNPMDYTYSITDDEPANELSTGTTHTLNSVQMSELGTYVCEVTNDAGTGMANVTIALGDPPVVSTVQPDPVVLGADVALMCSVTGDPTIDIVWEMLFPDGMVASTLLNASASTAGDYNFNVTSVTMTSYGMYRCSANSRFGDDSSNITLVQAISPSVSAGETVEFEIGTALTLSVSITDFNLPLTSIEWLFNSGSIPESLGTLTITNTSTDSPPATSTLTIDPVLTPVDIGVFSVRASNPAGSDDTQFTVTVSAPAVITSAPVDMTVTESNETVLVCIARGFPAPVISWSFEGRAITNDSDTVITSTTMADGDTGFYNTTSMLTFTSVDRANAGLYSCSAENTVLGESRNVSQDFTLTVNFPPGITSQPQPISVFSPDTITLICSADGHPIPTITWSRETVNTTNGTQEIITREFMPDDSNVNITTVEGATAITSTFSLMMTALEDTGDYSCTASNGFGMAVSDPAQVTVYIGAAVSSPVDGSTSTVNETMPFELTCIATGLPAPTITFTRAGEILGTPFTTNPPSSESLDSGLYQTTVMLSLASAMDENSGEITCVASNTVSDINQTREDSVTVELVVNVAPNITVPPVSTTIVSPDIAVFSCTADGVPIPTITWYLVYNDTETALPENDTSVMSNNVNDRLVMSNLTFFVTQPSQSGTYRCVASNLLNTDSADADLTVNDIPRFVMPIENTIYTVNETENAVFTCSASGIPAPVITWWRDGSELTNSQDRVTIDPAVTDDEYQLPGDRGTASLVTVTLTLATTVDSDSGQYSCRATGAGDPVTIDFELVVQVAPEITEMPDDTAVLEGENAVFNCIATGRPRPSITWYRTGENNTLLALDVSDSSITVTEDITVDRVISSTLTLSSVLPSTADTYTCITENIVDSAMANASLTVNVPAVITSVYPESGQTEYRVNAGDSVTFECVAIGIPAPDIQFNFSSIQESVVVGNLSTAVEVMRMSDGELVYQSTLTAMLDNAMDEQSGTYQCVADNGFGSSASQDFELIVQVAPTVTVSPEFLVVVQDNNAVFTCQADGVPRPVITWQYLGPDSNTTIAISADGDYTIDTNETDDRTIISTLTVLATEIADFGFYICTATNIVNSATSNARLLINVAVDITSLEPSALTVNQTNTASFTCTATGIPLPGIIWRGIDTNPLFNLSSGVAFDSRFSVNVTNDTTVIGGLETIVSILTIDSTVLADAGTYTCEAFNEIFNIDTPSNENDTETATLTVQVPPAVDSLVNNDRIVAEEGDNIMLVFNISNAVPPVIIDNIQWFYSRDSTVGDLSDPSVEEITDLVDRTRFSFSADRLTLTITDLVQGTPGNDSDPTDAGRYFLLATNPAGSDFAYIDVVVFGPPVIIDPPVDISVINGMNAVFPCNALAFPDHNISWQFTDYNGVTVDLTTDSSYTIDTNRTSPTFGQLTLLAVEYNDRGDYTCTAINIVESVTASGTLTVHVTPIIVDTSNLTEVNLGEPIVLVCLATGFPLPDITWQQNGEPVNIYSDGSLNTRVDIIQFLAELMESSNSSNETDGNGYQSSGYTGSGSITDLIMSRTNFSIERIMMLGELGVVGLLSFEETERIDTGDYTCNASNSLTMTGTRSDGSDAIPVFILERPDAPVNVTATLIQARDLTLLFIIVFDGNRPVTQFQITVISVETRVVTFNSTANPELFGTSQPSVMINGLLPFTNYSFTVVACNEIGCSNQSNASSIITTDEAPSTPPTSVAFVPNMTFIVANFSEPESANGIISSYTITYNGTRTFDNSFSDVGNVSMTVAELGSTSPFSITIPDLQPNTMYSLKLFAVNGAGDGDAFLLDVTTDNAAPVTPAPDQIPEVVVLPPGQVITDDPRTVTVSVITFDESNGPIGHYQIIAVRLPNEDFQISGLASPDTVFPLSDLPNFDDIDCGVLPTSPQAYITAEMSAAQYNALPNNLFVVGLNMDENDNSPNDRSDLTNGPLCYSTSYTFFVRAFTADNLNAVGKRQVTGRQYNLFVSSPYIPAASTIAGAPAPVAVIAAVIIIILLIVVVLLVVIIMVLVWKRRRTYEYKTRDATDNGTNVESLRLTEYRPPDEGSVARLPIPLSLLPDHIERMHLNENCGFVEEYKIINDNSPKNSVEACTTAENKPKNRYANIQCFDETRVMLTPIEGAEHDYINANFIEGYNRPREYIAAQGPLPDTCGDFWRMVWDYDAPTIVMLTNLVEKMKIKCSQYWPNTGTQQYANIKVTLINTVNQSDFIIRHFQIKKIDSDVVKEVRQFHFVSWPDFGVPRHATPLLHFMRRIRNLHSYSNDKPLIIHCSAGVGRTGTLITIDVELQRATKEGVVDPFNYVTQLRKQRNHLVQTEAQYAFLHDAILEGVTCGSTELKVENLTRAFDTLNEADQDGETGFHKEFNRLRQFKVDVKEFTDANDDANKFKNRIYNALPYNYNRVHLQMKPGVGGSDYINASYVDGYANKGQYIATQGPLANTVDDFWRMVWEKDVHVIVMLTQLEEKEQCALYWPDSLNAPEKMGSLSIETLSEKPFEDYTLREIKLADFTSTDGKNRVVKQYHFTAWPADGAPKSGAGMIDLIDQVTRTQAHTGNKPIVVHCSAGVGRTGAFCALSTSIDRVKTEGVVDVFHCVKHLRTQRPHMVQSAEQYAFCYVAIREYVESLSSYSNFQ